MASRKRNPEARMSLVAHLLELRKRLTIAAIAIIVAMVAGWFLSSWVWDVLRQPLRVLAAEGRETAITYGDITGGFDTKMQISLFIAVLLASPVWLYQLWAFLAPGLTKREKLYGVGFLAAAVPLFLGGAFVAWLIMPNIVKLMASFQPAEDAFFLSARSYLDFAVKLLLAVGIGFVVPAVLVALNMAGLLQAATIVRSWRIAILGTLVFAAMATPAADVMSMFLLALPMLVLYLLAALITVLHDRRVAKRTRAEFAEYGIDE